MPANWQFVWAIRVKFTATDKGESTLNALVVERAARIEDIISRHLDLKTLTNADDLLAALAKRLYEPYVAKEDSPNRRLRWAFAKVKYVIK